MMSQEWTIQVELKQSYLQSYLFRIITLKKYYLTMLNLYWNAQINFFKNQPISPSLNLFS